MRHYRFLFRYANVKCCAFPPLYNGNEVSVRFMIFKHPYSYFYVIQVLHRKIKKWPSLQHNKRKHPRRYSAKGHLLGISCNLFSRSFSLVTYAGSVTITINAGCICHVVYTRPLISAAKLHKNKRARALLHNKALLRIILLNYYYT